MYTECVWPCGSTQSAWSRLWWRRHGSRESMLCRARGRLTAPKSPLRFLLVTSCETSLWKLLHVSSWGADQSPVSALSCDERSAQNVNPRHSCRRGINSPNPRRRRLLGIGIDGRFGVRIDHENPNTEGYDEHDAPTIALASTAATIKVTNDVSRLFWSP